MMLWRGVLLLATAATALAQSDTEIRRILSDRIERDKKSKGIAVGLINAKGARRVLVHGDVKPESLFEVGSIAKVFTTLVLTDMVERAELRLSDPVQKFLPDGVRMPKRGRDITLEDLATHISGLPRMPTNLSPPNLADPYAAYTADRLYEFLRSYELPREPGQKWEYSNLGMGLLGHVLALRTGMDYETLARLRALGPLDMTDTWIRIPSYLEERIVKGHSVQLLPVAPWTFTDAMAGAGAFRSTAADMLEFLAAALGHKRTGLAPAFAAMLKVRHAATPDLGQAIGWNIIIRPNAEIIFKDGGTAGFSSAIMFVTKSRTGVVVLSDAFGGVVDLGMEILRMMQ